MISNDTESLQDIKKKSLTGIGSLVRRQIIIKALFFISNVILARILAPEIFGVYAIISFVVQFLSTFADVGLGAALIQKQGKLDNVELSTVFWTQQILVWSLVVIIYAAAPLILTLYPSLPTSSIWLIRAMSFSLIFSSLKTIPSILMEKKLNFKLISWIDVIENFVFYSLTIIFALMNFQVWSFVFAALIRSATGAILIYIVSPWKPSVQYRLSLVMDTIRFGMPYQANSILNFSKEAITPIFVGAFSGADAVGYVNWGKNLAFAPLIFSSSFERVAFPAFSKIQNDKENLAKAIQRSIRNMTMLMVPLSVLLMTLGPELTRVIYTEKWMPGIWVFYFYCTTPLAIGIMLPMYIGILSLGRSSILLKMTVLLLFLEWTTVVPLVMFFGFTGVAMNQPLVTLIFFFLYNHVLKREGVKIKLVENIKWQFISAALTGIILKLIILQYTLNIVTLALSFVIGCMTYAVIIRLLHKEITLEFKDYFIKVIGKNRDERNAG